MAKIKHHGNDSGINLLTFVTLHILLLSLRETQTKTKRVTFCQFGQWLTLESAKFHYRYGMSL